MVSLTPPSQSDRAYEWDGADRLVAINDSGTANRTEFTYDGQGRRVQIVEKTGGTVTATRRFLWDGGTTRVEKNATGAVTKRFFKQGAQILGGSATGNYYYCYDHLGSVREALDAGGTLRARYDYDLYGRRTPTAGDLDADTGLGGMFYHAPSGLGLTLTRAYDPALGRWLSRDPLGVSGGLHLYRYAANNPVSLTDPSGMCPDGWIKAAVAGAESLVDSVGNISRMTAGLASEQIQSTNSSGILSVLAGVANAPPAAVSEPPKWFSP